MSNNGVLFPAEIIFKDNLLQGKKVEESTKILSELPNIFEDTQAFKKMNSDTVVYNVTSYYPVESKTPGGLFWGITYIHPGTVGDEYFMTKGHIHEVENRAEFYWCLEGEGVLILMDKERNTWGEIMRPGSLHYIPGFTAHRAANTGNGILSFGACWPSDAGYNYEIIEKEGFSKRLKKINGSPRFV